MVNPYDAIDDLVSGSDPLVMGEDPIVGAVLSTLARRVKMPQFGVTRPSPATLAARASAGDQPATFLGIAPATNPVAAGATVPCTAQPTNPIRIVNFSVPAGVAANFTIAAIQIGRLNMLQSGQAIPASRFQDDSRRAPFEAPIVNSGTPITVSVTNVSGAAAPFFGSFDCIDLVQGV